MGLDYFCHFGDSDSSFYKILGGHYCGKFSVLLITLTNPVMPFGCEILTLEPFSQTVRLANKLMASVKQLLWANLDANFVK